MDFFQQASAIWKALDDMAEKDPERYKSFIEDQMKSAGSEMYGSVVGKLKTLAGQGENDEPPDGSSKLLSSLAGRKAFDVEDYEGKFKYNTSDVFEKPPPPAHRVKESNCRTKPREEKPPLSGSSDSKSGDLTDEALEQSKSCLLKSITRNSPSSSNEVSLLQEKTVDSKKNLISEL